MTQAPSFSVVVPTRGRRDELRACLRALAVTHPPPGGFEVIVVDDGGDAQGEDLGAGSVSGLALTVIEQSHAGPAAARNRGARAARGTFLAFVDADCLPEPAWLVELGAALSRSSPEVLVGGRTVDGCPDNRYSAASHRILDTVCAYYNERPEQARFFPTANLAVARQSFLDAGGFCEGFLTSEDRELCDRWRRLGRPLLYAPTAVVRHRHPVDCSRFLLRHFGYGRGAYRFHCLRAEREQRHLRLAAPSFYRQLFKLPRALDRRELDLTALVFLSQAASGVGFAWEALARRAGKTAGQRACQRG